MDVLVFKKNSTKVIFSRAIFLLLISFFILFQIALAENKEESFKIKDSCIEIQESLVSQTLSLVRKEGKKEEIGSQVRIVDQYLISDIEENEFLEKFPELRKGFSDLKIEIESDQPIFKKENFHYPPSLLNKAKSLFGFKTLPEYRIIKEINKSKNIQTHLDLSEISLTANYQVLETQFPLAIKQTITLTNNSNQDFNLSFLLKNRIDADKIYWNKGEYLVSGNPRKFGNPDRISFYAEDGKLSFYDYSDIPEEFSPGLWVERQNSQNFFILSLNIFIPAHSSKTIDPTYSTEITILNLHSHPQAGDNWTVSFETIDTADLTITPNDQETINDIDFVSLSCDEEQRIPQILENDVIFYPNWFCDGTGKVTHLVNIARGHVLKFQFGYQTAYAYNSPDETVYDFSSGTSSDKWAYYGKDDANDVPAAIDRSAWLVAGAEFADDYVRVATSNDTRATTTDATTVFKQIIHDFVIVINEATSTINSIDLHWEGHAEQNQEDAAENDLRMYLYNVSSTAWELVDSELNNSCSSSDCTMTYTATSSSYFSEYIDPASNTLRYLVQKLEEGDCCCDSSGTCYTEAADSPYNTGCTYQTDAQDLWGECTQGTTQSDGCASNNCSGSSYACGVQSSGDGGCPVCQNCTDADIACEYYAVNTGDTGCDNAAGTCYRCNGSGACTYQTDAQDLWSECGGSGCQEPNCDGGSYACALYKDDAQHNCNVCYACDGSGNCTARTVDYSAATALGCNFGDEACRKCTSGACGYYEDNEQHDCAFSTVCISGGVCGCPWDTCSSCCIDQGHTGGWCANTCSFPNTIDVECHCVDCSPFKWCCCNGDF